MANSNEDEFEELARSIVSIVVSIRDVLIATTSNHAPSDPFDLRCRDFLEYVFA